MFWFLPLRGLLFSFIDVLVEHGEHAVRLFFLNDIFTGWRQFEPVVILVVVFSSIAGTTIVTLELFALLQRLGLDALDNCACDDHPLPDVV